MPKKKKTTIPPAPARKYNRGMTDREFISELSPANKRFLEMMQERHFNAGHGSLPFVQKVCHERAVSELRRMFGDDPHTPLPKDWVRVLRDIHPDQ